MDRENSCESMQLFAPKTQQFNLIFFWLPPEHVSGAERGASEERSVQNIVGARSGFLSKGWSDRSVSLRFRSDTAHTTSLGHAQIHPEFTCAFNN